MFARSTPLKNCHSRWHFVPAFVFVCLDLFFVILDKANTVFGCIELRLELDVRNMGLQFTCLVGHGILVWKPELILARTCAGVFPSVANSEGIAAVFVWNRRARSGTRHRARPRAAFRIVPQNQFLGKSPIYR
jgi:hypothetical protein